MAQTYEPYRSKVLSKEQLQQLNSLKPLLAVVHTLLNWSLIFLAWLLVSQTKEVWLIVLAIPWIGTRFYALFIIAHDGLHRRIFPNRTMNDLWNDAFILGAIGAITRINRSNHMTHHSNLATPEDPDRFKYLNQNKNTHLLFASFLTGLSFVFRAVVNVFVDQGNDTKEKKFVKSNRDSYQFRDIIILIAWQVILIGGLSYFIGWWAYPVLWLLPVYLFVFVADLVRVFSEHSMPIADDLADKSIRLISFESNFLEKQFFAPNNMNFHAVHHLWPSIPYYNLPTADALVRDSSVALTGLLWRKSYLGYLLDYWREIPVAINLSENSDRNSHD